MANITFNGRTYNSLEDMPANERQAYEQMMNIFADRNGNGIPDIMEGDMVQNVMKAHSTNISIGGNTIHTMNDLTPEARESMEKAFRMLSQLGILPKDIPATTYTQSASPTTRKPMITSRPFVSREYNPMLQDDKGAGAVVWIGLGAALILCCAGAGAVWAYLLM